LLPVASFVPLLDALYQSITAPDEAAANNVTAPLPQRSDDVLDDTEGMSFTVASTAVRADTQPVAVLRASA
jgi:hypothetical protein